MINLLPKNYKEKLLAEKYKRAVFIIGFLVIFFLVVLALTLLIIRTYLYQKIVSDSSSLMKSEIEIIETDVADFAGRINLANQNFTKLSIFYNRKVYFSEIIRKISAILPESFYLTNLSIDLDVKENKIAKSGGGTRTEISRQTLITVSGLAPGREELLIFKSSLENEGSFIDITFPSSNWIKREDIDFYITFRANL